VKHARPEKCEHYEIDSSISIIVILLLVVTAIKKELFGFSLT
jgi:hypothetical protein